MAVQLNNNETKKKKKSYYLPKFCFRIEYDATGEGFDMEIVDASASRPPKPSHLIIMVNGLIGSAQNWKFAAKQFLKKYPHDAVVHCSECNSAMLTFDGVDVMGDRLAKEVISVIKRHPSVEKISFVGHSLGGLIARYAIAKLYERDISMEFSYENGKSEGQSSLVQEFHDRKKNYEGKIAGLEPINFITSATPHLGASGHKQCPMFFGFRYAEKVATRASGLLGKTGKHLFLADGSNGKPPLLLQMAHDSEDLKFMSALRSCKRHVAYANVRYDKLVGWSTSSIRHRNELPKRRNLSSHERYPHIVNVETARSSCVPTERGTKNSGLHRLDMEEEMIRSLTTISWERVDVRFSGTMQKFLAHSTIQVKTYSINSAGTDVVQHMVDNFQL
ncbi:lipid droplet phospholipase 1 [Arachis duranensis]|uniref:Lipid droplet phospholipase 1 n=1 Tax=Arachis duranensis TaxID=130453 RepID=A0A6P4BTQ8_ARADU|nr:lipid droplet phospholipase 1 [Arachis duranensis]